MGERMMIDEEKMMVRGQGYKRAELPLLKSIITSIQRSNTAALEYLKHPSIQDSSDHHVSKP